MTTYVRTPLTGAVDFSMMYAAHDAFARDLDRMLAATSNGNVSAAVTGGWQVFVRQLHLHHRSEDAALWPPLLAAVRQPGEVLVLEEMAAEHAEIEPHLVAVDAALAASPSLSATRAGLSASVTALRSGLVAHMEHEETSALPLVEAYLGRKGWGGFVGHIRKEQGLRGAAEFLPWLLEGAPAATKAAVLGRLPVPARLIYRLVWAPRWRRHGYWTS